MDSLRPLAALQELIDSGIFNHLCIYQNSEDQMRGKNTRTQNEWFNGGAVGRVRPYPLLQVESEGYQRGQAISTLVATHS